MILMKEMYSPDPFFCAFTFPMEHNLCAQEKWEILSKGRALKVSRQKNGKFDDEKTTFKKQQSSQ